MDGIPLALQHFLVHRIQFAICEFLCYHSKSVQKSMSVLITLHIVESTKYLRLMMSLAEGCVTKELEKCL